MKKLVVFDWNGVLLADAHANLEADNHVLKIFGGKAVNLGQYRNSIVIPAIDFYVEHGCNRKELKKNYKKLGQVFEEYYEPRADKCKKRQGAKYLLRWLCRHSIENIILSNHTVDGINVQLERLKLSPYFSNILANIGSDVAMKERNKGEKIKQYLKIHKIRPNDALIVGDSPEEVEIGKAVGIETVAITNGLYSTARLQDAKPDHLIHNLSEIIKIVKK